MKLTVHWLKEFVSFRGSPQKIAEALTMAGLEVESLVPLPAEGEGGNDWLIEISVTPNRGDCLGILGVAREIAALTGEHFNLPPPRPHSADPPHHASSSEPSSVLRLARLSHGPPQAFPGSRPGLA